jgi:hypothetical protein
MLKAYLRIKYPEVSRFVGFKYLQQSVLPVTPSHDLVAHAKLVEISFPDIQLLLLTKHEWLLKELSLQFERKYPDNALPHSSSTTEWLVSIDDLMVKLSMHLPVDRDTRWATGVFACAWPLVLIGQPDPPWFQWVRDHNHAFKESFSEIARIVVDGHNSYYPDSQLVHSSYI